MSMKGYFLSYQAEQDIEEILQYLVQENSESAYKFLDSFHSMAELLSENPLIGHTRKDLTSHSVRFYTFKWHYLIIYAPCSPLEIVRILSGYRDIANLLNNDK